MSTKPVETTNTAGYFNAHQHRVHIVIARYNITLELAPGEYVKDSRGRNINDPFFDAYTYLSKETSPTPVPLIRLALPTSPGPNQRFDGHSVRQVTEFTQDARGVRRPVMPQRTVVPAASDPNQPSIRSMSVDEARRLGLIRHTRHVPEDYGITDTDGAPPAGAPPIKLATDLPPRNQSTTSTASGTPRTAPAAQTPAPAVPRAKPVPAPVEEALPLPDVDEASADDGLGAPEIENPLSTANAASLMAQAAIAPSAQGNHVPAIPPVVKTLPAYDDADGGSEPASASDPILVDRGPDAEHVTDEAKVAEAVPAEAPADETGKFVCAADGKRFNTYGELAGHVRRHYKDLKVVRQLLAPYASARASK